MRTIRNIMFLSLMLLSNFALAQNTDSTKSSNAPEVIIDSSKTKNSNNVETLVDSTFSVLVFKPGTGDLIEYSGEPKCGLPRIGFSTDGYWFFYKDTYDLFHSLVDGGFNNDEKPVVMENDNNWLKIKDTRKQDLSKGESHLVKVNDDEYFYVHKEKRNLYHQNIPQKCCWMVQIDEFVPAMVFEPYKHVKITEKVVKETDDDGVIHYNYMMLPTVLPEDIKKQFDKAFEK